MEDGYYWATHIEFEERQIVEIIEGTVYVMGDDRIYKVKEFSSYLPIPKEATLETSFENLEKRGANGD